MKHQHLTGLRLRIHAIATHMTTHGEVLAKFHVTRVLLIVLHLRHTTHLGDMQDT